MDGSHVHCHPVDGGGTRPLPLRPRHGYAAALHRGLPGQACGTPPRSSPAVRLGQTVRTAQPAHIHRVRAGQKLKEPRHRFLAYAFPSRSPGPTHPAVLGRPDFVAAAPTLPSVPRVRLPPASARRYDSGPMKVSHLHPDKQHLVAHHRSLYSPRPLVGAMRTWQPPPAARDAPGLRPLVGAMRTRAATCRPGSRCGVATPRRGDEDLPRAGARQHPSVATPRRGDEDCRVASPAARTRLGCDPS